MLDVEAEIIAPTEKYVQAILGKDTSGHDWFHIIRVRKLALYIAKSEPNADFLVVELAALLHDIADWKFHDGDENIGPEKARVWLSTLPKISKPQITVICDIIKNLSFKGARVESKVDTLEGKIVQDADRLDAIGAIGIARAFAFGGHKGHSIYDPEEKPVLHDSVTAYKNKKASTVIHFYEKLLHLKDLMNTTKARQIAEQRHQILLDFLRQFQEEWNYPTK